MTDFEKALMNRDGLTADEAEAVRAEASAEAMEMLAEGADYDDMEELLMDYGLEMDYIFDLL